jgi:hypothetical protein
VNSGSAGFEFGFPVDDAFVLNHGIIWISILRMTTDGSRSMRLMPSKVAPDTKARRALLEALRAAAAGKATTGPEAARSQDFLYYGDGLPG